MLEQTTPTAPIVSVAPRTLAAALLTLTLGCALIFTVGFVPVDTVHNAAHDTRHSAAFPCH